jgi:hypothetical protein
MADASGNTTPAITTTKNILSDIFNQTNIIILFWFLAIYFVLYFIMGTFFKGPGGANPAEMFLSKSVDFILVGLILILTVWSYFSLSEADKQDLLGYGWQWTRDYLNTPSKGFSLVLMIIAFYVVIYLFRIPMTEETKPATIYFLENKLWIFLATVIIVNFFRYILNINLVDIVMGTTTKLWNEIPMGDISGNLLLHHSNNRGGQEEVFNIGNNLYSYDDAQAVCAAYGARLATYDEVEDAYNKGGEWCNYGWSANQIILFPTQKSTWNTLQQSKEHKNDCGRPGVNGGYIANPYVTFGANCMGKKPAAKANDLAMMNANKLRPFPKSEADLALEAKIKKFMDNSGNMLSINSFNHDNWNEY